MPRFTVRIIAAAAIVLGASMVSSQGFPNKPLRIITAGAGGGSDIVARLIAQGVAGPLGQQVIVVNYSSSVVPGEVVSKAPADGYTMLVTGNTFWIGPLLQKTPYDPVRDFAPISLVASAPAILVVHPSLPVTSVKELIALAKSRPGELNYFTNATGGPTHLAGELFKSMAGVNIVRIPYKSDATGIADLIGGQVQLTFGSASTVAPHIKSGRLRALAVTTAQASTLFPGLPTLAASGLPGYEAGLFSCMFAPAKTPAALVNRLSQEIVRALKTTETKERFFGAGVETVGTTPEELAAFIKSDMATWAKVIKDAGIRAD